MMGVRPFQALYGSYAHDIGLQVNGRTETPTDARTDGVTKRKHNDSGSYQRRSLGGMQIIACKNF